MAYSLEDELYLALYTVWSDPADDPRYETWAADHMRSMEHLATGIQLADENLGQRTAKFVEDENLARLDRVRADYDPEGRFHAWLSRP